MSNNYDALNKALSKTTSGLKETSQVLEKAASQASELNGLDSAAAAADIKTAAQTVSAVMRKRAPCR